MRTALIKEAAKERRWTALGELVRLTVHPSRFHSTSRSRPPLSSGAVWMMEQPGQCWQTGQGFEGRVRGEKKSIQSHFVQLITRVTDMYFSVVKVDHM